MWDWLTICIARVSLEFCLEHSVTATFQKSLKSPKTERGQSGTIWKKYLYDGVEVRLDKYKAKGGSQYSLSLDAAKGSDSGPYNATVVVVSVSKKTVLFTVDTQWKEKFPFKDDRAQLHTRLKTFFVTSKTLVSDTRVFLVPENIDKEFRLMILVSENLKAIKRAREFSWLGNESPEACIAFVDNISETEFCRDEPVNIVAFSVQDYTKEIAAGIL